MSLFKEVEVTSSGNSCVDLCIPAMIARDRHISNGVGWIGVKTAWTDPRLRMSCSGICGISTSLDGFERIYEMTRLSFFFPYDRCAGAADACIVGIRLKDGR